MPSPRRQPFHTLRRYVRRQESIERCELCSATLASEHDHLIELESRKLLCSCSPCALLFSGSNTSRYRHVPRQARLFPQFQMTDPQWEELHIPINLAWFFQSTSVNKVVAIYPSPAGATESLLPLETWEELVRDNPILAELEPDVEALLVNRLGSEPEHYTVPIDQCYKLVGLIRMNWHGFSGGAGVWREIEGFFRDLREKAEIYQ